MGALSFYGDLTEIRMIQDAILSLYEQLFDQNWKTPYIRVSKIKKRKGGENLSLKTTYTYTCKACGKQFSVSCPGILQLYPKPMAELGCTAHNIAKHRKEIGWKKWFRAIGRVFVLILELLVFTVLTLFVAATYVLYPLYLPLALWFEGRF